MQRVQLVALLDDAKANNGGSPDFLIRLPRPEVGSALMILAALKGNGTITGFDRRSPPDDDGIDITGYTG